MGHPKVVLFALGIALAGGACSGSLGRIDLHVGNLGDDEVLVMVSGVEGDVLRWITVPARTDAILRALPVTPGGAFVVVVDDQCRARTPRPWGMIPTINGKPAP